MQIKYITRSISKICFMKHESPPSPGGKVTTPFPQCHVKEYANQIQYSIDLLWSNKIVFVKHECP